MKIKTLKFDGEKIILPKKIEINFKKDDTNAKAMWKSIKAIVKEWKKDIKKGENQ